MVDVTMPQLGETVTEGTITRWFKQIGDDVAMDEILFEVSTDKVDSEVPSPVEGTLSEILAEEGDVVEVGQVLARVGDAAEEATPTDSADEDEAPVEAPQEETPSAAPADSAPPPPPPPPPASSGSGRAESDAPPPPPPPSQRPADEAPESGPAPDDEAASADDQRVLSPVVRRLIAEHDLDPSTITGTGVGGRITRSDVEQRIERGGPARDATPRTAAPEAEPESPPESSPSSASAAPAVASGTTLSPRDTVVPLNNIRKRTAEHMVMSTATSAHVLTAMEVDYERVEHVRRKIKSGWKADEGFSLTYLPFIARAVVDALREYPHLNASFGGDHVVLHDEVNLAIAVDIDFDGLLAPVVRSADGKRLRQIARDIVDLAERARTKQLMPDDLSSGTFTLTNAGQYGTMMQFPIINQPQVAILSTDGVKRKPVVVTDDYGNESIAIHSVGVLALAWDHRAFDGAYAAAFLDRVREIIETRDWEAEVN